MPFIYQAAITPNDLDDGLWGLNNEGQTGGTIDADIDGPEAWNITTGTRDVVVGVIDTGIDYNHIDLASNMWRNIDEIEGNGIDDDNNGYVDDVYGWDFVNNDNDPWDDNSHGTHVSGTIGGVGNNGQGVVGVNWEVSLMALKFLDAGGFGNTVDAIEAVNYATMMRQRYVSADDNFEGANVVLTSNSWGGGGYSEALEAAIQAAGQNEILFVAAAGNADSDNDANPSYPSGYALDNIIAVAATDHDDDKASFSSYGATTVDLGAPGVDTWSTIPNDRYGYKSGTSMATPHVSGVAALVWGVAGEGVTYQTVKQAIFDGVDPIPSMDGITVTGGRLNAFNALQNVGMVVSSSTPESGEVVFDRRTSFVVDFSYPVDDTTSGESSDLEATDFTVSYTNELDETTVYVADQVFLDPDNKMRAEFRFDSSPIISDQDHQGEYTMQIAAGEIRTSSSLPDDPLIKGWNKKFRYDAHLMGVSGTDPARGSVVTLPMGQLKVTFTEPYDPGSADISDLILNQGKVESVNTATGDPNSVIYVLTGITQEDVLTVSMRAGALTDLYGNPMDAYPISSGWDLDWNVTSYPVPLDAKAPLGSLIYDPVIEGAISYSGDTDSFTIWLDPGQAMTVAVYPTDGLNPSVSITGPGITVDPTANAGVGEPEIVQAAGLTGGGLYTITVAGESDTTGEYSMQLVLNAVLEQETDTPGQTQPQNIDNSFIPLVGSAERGAVLGTIEDTGCVGPGGFDYEACVVDVDLGLGSIASSGKRLATLDGVDDGAELLKRAGKPSGFSFDFYGTSYTEKQVYASTNGLMTFESGYSGYFNSELTSQPNPATIAPFWDDLMVDNFDGSAGVYWQIFDAADGSQYLVVEWDQVKFLGSSGKDPISFQAVLYEVDPIEPSKQNTIYFRYLDLDSDDDGAGGASATAGIKDVGAQGDNRLLISQNAGPNAFIGHGLTVRIGQGTAPQVETPDVYEFNLAADERATVALVGSAGDVQLELLDSNSQSVGVGLSPSNATAAIELPGGAGGTYQAVVTGAPRAQYSLVVTKGAFFDLESNSGPDLLAGDPYQTIALDSDNSAIVLGYIGGGAGAEALIGYYTDYNTGTTNPETAILAAGFTPVHIEDIGTFDLMASEIDVLMVNESNNGGISEPLLGRLPEIRAWVEEGGVLMVHDRFVSSGAADSNPLLVGAPEIIVERNFEFGADIDVIPPANNLVVDGPLGEITDTTLDGGNLSNHGFAHEETFPDESLSILSAGPVGVPNNVSAFSYELNNGAVYYSTIPLDYYLSGSNNFSDIYAPNALNYAYSLANPDSDFYAIDIPANETGNLIRQLNLTTLIPGYPPTGEFRNEFDPMIRLYEIESPASLVPLAADDDSGGERNPMVHYTLPDEGGTYIIEVRTSDDPAADRTRGEYVLTADVSEQPLPGISVSRTSLTTEEGGLPQTFSIVLNTDPGEDASVTLPISLSASGQQQVSLSTSSVTFTGGVAGDWAAPQDVHVMSIPDDIDEEDTLYTIFIHSAETIGSESYEGIDPPDISAIHLDDDTAAITVTPTEGLVTMETGETTDLFTIRLESEPTSDVIVDVRTNALSQGVVSTPGNAGVDGSTVAAGPAETIQLTFNASNWYEFQEVLLHGVDDDVDDGNFVHTLSVLPGTGNSDPYYAALAPIEVTATNIDNDDSNLRARILDDFEDGDLSEYREKATPNASVDLVAARDGQYGLLDLTNGGYSGWSIRTDTQAQVAQGDILSVWVRTVALDWTRAYFGFGTGGKGTLAIVMGVNTGQFLLNQVDRFENYVELVETDWSWEPDHWYRMEVDWGSTDPTQIIGRLYDSDGISQLTEIASPVISKYTSGGIAFRGFGTDIHFDTAEVRSALVPAVSASQDLVSLIRTPLENRARPVTKDEFYWQQDENIQLNSIQRPIGQSEPAYFAALPTLGESESTSHEAGVDYVMSELGWDLEDQFLSVKM